MKKKKETLLEQIDSNEGRKETENPYLNKAKWQSLEMKKKEMKETDARMRYDSILSEIDQLLIDTTDKNFANPSTGQSTQIMYFPTPNGGVEYVPMLMKQNGSSTTSVPQVKKPFAFAKVNIATSLLGSKVPDGKFEADDKIYAAAYYQLWKKTWTNCEGNGQNAYQSVVQKAATTGFGAIKTIYKQVLQPVKSGDTTTQRVRFDDVYRIPMDTSRLWVGVGYNNSDYWSKTEYLYEEDIPYEEFKFRMEQFGVTNLDENFINFVKSSMTPEGKKEDSKKVQTHVTLTHYENELTNTYLVMCGSYCLYDGELISPDGYASITTCNFLVRDERDPYGVGLWELCRGSDALMNHLSFMNAQQVEAEISPIVFATQTGMGNGTLMRGPNQINPKAPGTEIDVVRTTGNPSGSMGLVQNESKMMDEITALTDVVAGLGSEITLGGTVIAKEAALQRLSIPRNSLVALLTRDAYVTCSYFHEYYGQKRVLEMPSNDAVKSFMATNPTYFVDTVIDEDGMKAMFSKKISMPFMLNIDSNSPLGYNFDEQEGATYSRSELMARLHIITEQEPLSRTLSIIIDPSSMLQPSEEITQQKVTGMLPMLQTMSMQAIQMAQQDPILGKTLMKQLFSFLKVMRLDPYEWLPKEIVESVLAGDLADPQMQQLGQANRMMDIQEKMSKVGIPQQVDMNNLPQTQNSMQDAYNSSVGKL